MQVKTDQARDTELLVSPPLDAGGGTSSLAFPFSNAISGPAMPERVRQAIARQQDGSERLIGWLQLCIVLFFGLLYLIAPKTYEQTGTGPTPVTMALGLYLAFTCLRLVLAYRMRLPGWFLVMSSVADIALLYGLIFSFHTQYGQPASFFLKAPTLLYVFIFIALRALRFEPFYVVVTGIAAALGWSVMVLYVLFGDPSDRMITRDYVEYLTSNAVLIGAEVDKIVTILVVTGVLALAIWRGRDLLVRAVAAQTARQDLARFFDPEVADRIVGRELSIRPGEGELREAAILMVDIRGFTRLSTEMEPARLMVLLANYQTRVREACRPYGGTVDKFLGDGIMLSFGAALPSREASANALRAVEAILATLDAWNAKRRSQGRRTLEFGLAVVSGTILFGAVGDADRLEYTVIGDAVNSAAKIEKHNRAEESRALTTRDTLERAEAEGYRPSLATQILPDRRVAGMDAPIDLVRLA